MKKYTIPILIIVTLIAIVGFIYYQNHISQIGQSNNYTASKTSTENETQNQNTSQDNSSNEISVPAITEQEISSFSTKVHGTSARKNNISICSSILNGTTITPGQTFSFWGVIGNTTAEKGYQKAKSFDKDGHTIQTYGGGVCQVSTTLYNAVLAIPDLKVTERHPHSKRVTYVAKDKDASVCYSSSDFKFINNSSNTIKIYTNYDKKTLSIRIIRLSNG